MLRLRKQKIQIVLLMLSCCLLSPQGTATTVAEYKQLSTEDFCRQAKDACGDETCLKGQFGTDQTGTDLLERYKKDCVKKTSGNSGENSAVKMAATGIGMAAGTAAIVGTTASFAGRKQAQKNTQAMLDNSEKTKIAAQQTAEDTRKMLERKETKDAAARQKQKPVQHSPQANTKPPLKRSASVGSAPQPRSPKPPASTTPHTPLMKPIQTGKPQQHSQTPLPQPSRRNSLPTSA